MVPLGLRIIAPHRDIAEGGSIVCARLRTFQLRFAAFAHWHAFGASFQGSSSSPDIDEYQPSSPGTIQNQSLYSASAARHTTSLRAAFQKVLPSTVAEPENLRGPGMRLPRPGRKVRKNPACPDSAHQAALPRSSKAGLPGAGWPGISGPPTGVRVGGNCARKELCRGKHPFISRFLAAANGINPHIGKHAVWRENEFLSKLKGMARPKIHSL